MNSFVDSNSVPVGATRTRLSSAIAVHGNSDDTAANNGHLRFQVELYDDYRHRAVLPELPTLTGTTRWITIKTQHGRSYKIDMVDDGAGFLLDRGWSLLVAIENLQQGQTLMFQQEDQDTFSIWIHRPLHSPPPIGLSSGRQPSPNNAFGPTHLVIDSGTEMGEAVLQTIRQVWMESSADGPVYVCRLIINPSEINRLIFNKSYSRLIPRNETNIAMRFIGSNIIVPGGFKTYGNGDTRLVKWSMYAKEHNLVSGEIFVCKIHRGPSIPEFVGFCVGRT